MAQGKFDVNAFNTDPKHAEQREFLDSIVESSAKRIHEKNKKAGKKEDVNIFDSVFGPIFGGGNEEEK
mgnify:CR=1 FL=1